MKEAFIVWLIAAMNALAPAHRDHFVPEARESYAQADARYREIAEAIVNVSFDQNEPTLFSGSRARMRTGYAVMYQMFHESGFRRDIQYGYGRERHAQPGINDNGRSWCLGQVMLGVKRVNIGNGQWRYDSATTTPEGWTGRQLMEDIDKCTRATLHYLVGSFGACRHLPFEDRLAAAATGNCDSETGRKISRNRMRGMHRSWDRRAAGLPSLELEGGGKRAVNDLDLLQVPVIVTSSSR